MLDEFAAHGTTLYGVSCDADVGPARVQPPGVDIEQLSDFEPKGATCRAFGVLHPARLPPARTRALGPDAAVRWSYGAASPGDLPGANLIFDALYSSPLTASAPPPAPRRPGRPCPGDPPARRSWWSTGDYECPFCAALEERLRALPLRIAFRHFPARLSAHPRAFRGRVRRRGGRMPGSFWPMHDSLFADQGAGSRTRTCGPGRSGSASTSRASTPTAARRPWPTAPRGGLPRRPARRRADDADALRGRRAPRRAARTTSAVGRDSALPGGDGGAFVAARLAARTTAVAGRVYQGPMPAADAHLARSACAPDDTGEALRTLYRAYGGELYGFAYNALGERGVAEEIVQEVFLRAWRHADRYDPGARRVRTWLYQIARHAIIDARRRAAVRPGLAAHQPSPGSEPGGDARAGDARVAGRRGARAAVARAPPGDPPRPGPGTDHARDQRAHGLPVGTVKSRTWYALRALRLVLEEMGMP